MSLFSNSENLFCTNILIPYVEIVYKKNVSDKHFDTLGRELDALPFLCIFSCGRKSFHISLQ